MTREEALYWLDTIPTIGEQVDALDMAIKALEQEPCEDAISRQAAKRALEDRFMELQKRHDDKRYETNYCLNTILELPSVNPQEKTGHWVGIDEEPHEDYECDKCGYVVSTFTENIEPHTEYKFCPNCGCRMVEPQERSE